MAEESRSQGASTARWLAVGGALVTGVTGIVMAGFSLVGGEETGAGALLAASALAFGFLAANLDRSSARGPIADRYGSIVGDDGASQGEAEAQPLTAAAVAAPGQTSAPRMNDGPSLRHRLPGMANIDAEPVSQRESEVLSLVAEGYSNKLISAELGISERTVKNHLTTTMGKLRASDRTHAVVTAVRLGWLDIHGDS